MLVFYEKSFNPRNESSNSSTTTNIDLLGLTFIVPIANRNQIRCEVVLYYAFYLDITFSPNICVFTVFTPKRSVP